ncbi:MAG: M1 family metallopeptidase [Saprospiraceae bacterium]|nr:M1 family metallopeptidase [Saprospiraceae bacterium]
MFNPPIVYIIVLLFLCASDSVKAQYFQQNVAYDISASQDTSNHTITATCDITYTNNAPNDLDTIFLHLWANAFSDKLSAYSNQVLNMGDTKFYFANEKKMGGYRNLDVVVNNSKITLYQWKKNPDVVYFLLPKKLKSQETLNIKTTYELQLPKKFSRMGFTNFDNYLMYWYPTPAVYDQNGWHPMPYLAMGELFTEIGDYTIQLATPLSSLISSSPYTYNSAQNIYTFQGEDLIDFAIVTSKNKKRYTHSIETASGNLIDISILTKYPRRDSSAIQYLTSALDYFEPIIGDFPYPTLSVLDKGLKSTSGMEYPGLITISGKDNEEGNFEYYIVHELLHQWFYSALAFNQRDHAWLDEGLTTYFQQRYYKEVKKVDHYTKKGGLVMHHEQQPFLQTIARGQACRHYHLPIHTAVEHTDPVNYGLNAYEIPARMFAYLAEYLGQEIFDKGIQKLYINWKGKHPAPNQFQKILEEFSKKDLSWFFDELIHEDWSYDYAISSINESTLVVNHKDGSTPPYKVTFKTKEGKEQSIWVDGHTDTKSIPLPGPEYTQAIIDQEALSMDLNRNNNSIQIKRPIKLIPGVKLEDGRYKEIYFMPTVSYNTSDGGQLGMAFFNSSFPSKKLKWAISPAYGFNSGKLIGEGWISYDHYLKGSTFRKLQFKLNAKSYHFRYSETLDKNLRFTRISPNISLHLGHEPKDHKYSKIYLKPIFLNEEKFVFNENDEVSIANTNSTILRLGFEHYDFWSLGPSEFTTQIEFQPYKDAANEQQHYLKLTTAYSKSFLYAPKRSFDVRFWGTYFLSNTKRESPNYDPSFVRGSAALIYQGFNDYAYDDYFFNRANQDVSLENQIGFLGGGFKTPFGSQYNIGQTNNFAFALNIKSNLPIKTPKLFPLKLFLDVGYYSSKDAVEAPLEGRSFYSGGVLLEYGQGLFSIYLPLVNSQAISEIYDTEGIGILGRISFNIDLIRFNPWDIAEDHTF